MRSPGGYEIIKKAIGHLEKRHDVHIAAYGEGNSRRLTGSHETASMDFFKWVMNSIVIKSISGFNVRRCVCHFRVLQIVVRLYVLVETLRRAVKAISRIGDQHLTWIHIL